MLGGHFQFDLSTVLLITLMMSNLVLSQSTTDLEKSPVPPEVRARLDLYFEFLHKQDWEKLYEIEAWPKSDKGEFIATHIKFKGNTYESVSKILKVGLNDLMTHYLQSKGWRIDGCTKFRDKNKTEITAIGSGSVFKDPLRGWIFLSFLPSLYADGWRACDRPIDEFPIKILDK